MLKLTRTAYGAFKKSVIAVAPDSIALVIPDAKGGSWLNFKQQSIQPLHIDEDVETVLSLIQ